MTLSFNQSLLQVLNGAGMRVRVRNPKKYTYSPDPLPPINTPVKETTNIYNSVQHPFSMTDQKISDKSKPNISHEEHRISNATPEKKEKSSHLAHSLLNEQRKVKKQQETVTQQVFCIPKLKVLLFSSSFVVLFAFCFVLFVRKPFSSFFSSFFQKRGFLSLLLTTGRENVGRLLLCSLAVTQTRQV